MRAASLDGSRYLEDILGAAVLPHRAALLCLPRGRADRRSGALAGAAGRGLDHAAAGWRNRRAMPAAISTSR